MFFWVFLPSGLLSLVLLSWNCCKMYNCSAVVSCGKITDESVEKGLLFLTFEKFAITKKILPLKKTKG